MLEVDILNIRHIQDEHLLGIYLSKDVQADNSNDKTCKSKDTRRRANRCDLSLVFMLNAQLSYPTSNCHIFEFGTFESVAIQGQIGTTILERVLETKHISCSFKDYSTLFMNPCMNPTIDNESKTLSSTYPSFLTSSSSSCEECRVCHQDSYTYCYSSHFHDDLVQKFYAYNHVCNKN